MQLRRRTADKEAEAAADSDRHVRRVKSRPKGTAERPDALDSTDNVRAEADTAVGESGSQDVRPDQPAKRPKTAATKRGKTATPTTTAEPPAAPAAASAPSPSPKPSTEAATVPASAPASASASASASAIAIAAAASATTSTAKRGIPRPSAAAVVAAAPSRIQVAPPVGHSSTKPVNGNQQRTTLASPPIHTQAIRPLRPSCLGLLQKSTSQGKTQADAPAPGAQKPKRQAKSCKYCSDKDCKASQTFERTTG
ncbi:hypothetical protein BC831DRAFT_458878 [Entophlyctis helioformis]|nr:hypothetical protein BC831DRAFT_458878 [Entophlyctis helioformis]